MPEPVTKELEIVPALIAEVLGTMLYVYVYLNVFTTRGLQGILISEWLLVSLMLRLYTFQSVSQGAFNPAVALGITMGNLTSWSSIWVFLVANFAGGVLAAFCRSM
jgi:aquaporin Z